MDGGADRMSNFYVYLRNPKSGEVHRVVEDGSSRFVDERCNLDDAGVLDRFENGEQAAREAVAHGSSWCGHCCAGLIANAAIENMVATTTFPGDAAESATEVVIDAGESVEPR
jgi:hypothetical protein